MFEVSFWGQIQHKQTFKVPTTSNENGHINVDLGGIMHRSNDTKHQNPLDVFEYGVSGTPQSPLVSY